MLERVGPFQKGDRPSASWLQQMLNALKMVCNITAAPPLRVTMTPGGVLLSMTSQGGGTETMYQVNTLVPLTQTSGFPVYNCVPTNSTGSTATPVWTRPDVALSDPILCVKPTNSTGITIVNGTNSTSVLWMQVGADSPGIFPALIQKTGGISSTSATSSSTFTYTARLITYTGSGTSSDYELGTVLAVTKPREVGQRTSQLGSVNGYALCFYIGNTLKLWDAGEIIQGGGC